MLKYLKVLKVFRISEFIDWRNFMDKLTAVSHDFNLNLWITRIKECRKSGMKVTAWCQENNIGIKTYYYWMRKIKREAFESLPAEIKESIPALSDSKAPVFSRIDLSTDKRSAPQAAVTIHLNGITIDVQDGASEMMIQRTLRAVCSLC
jgi:arsenate reductase-like glutaredoxin family protein